MTARTERQGFASRPVDAEAWVKAPGAPAQPQPATAYTARLTIDVTPEMRGRIKVTAFQRGETVADMIRALFAREYPDGEQAS